MLTETTTTTTTTIATETRDNLSLLERAFIKAGQKRPKKHVLTTTEEEFCSEYDMTTGDNPTYRLDLMHRRIHNSECIILARILKKPHKLISVDLSGPWFKYRKVKEIPEGKIEDSGCIAIADAMKTDASVLSLRLGCNIIRDAGAKAIAEALMVNTTLTMVSLGENKIGDKGAKAFVPVLKKNPSLRTFYLHFNLITDEGADALMEGVKANKVLQSLYLKENKISPECYERIRAHYFAHPKIISDCTHYMLDNSGDLCDWMVAKAKRRGEVPWPEEFLEEKDYHEYWRGEREEHYQKIISDGYEKFWIDRERKDKETNFKEKIMDPPDDSEITSEDPEIYLGKDPSDLEPPNEQGLIKKEDRQAVMDKYWDDDDKLWGIGIIDQETGEYLPGMEPKDDDESKKPKNPKA